MSTRPSGPATARRATSGRLSVRFMVICGTLTGPKTSGAARRPGSGSSGTGPTVVLSVTATRAGAVRRDDHGPARGDAGEGTRLPAAGRRPRREAADRARFAAPGGLVRAAG